MLYPPYHKGTPQHRTTHDDPIALHIDSRLELELQHTEEAERHRDQTPPEPQPLANYPLDPDRAGSPQSAPPQPATRERAL